MPSHQNINRPTRAALAVADRVHIDVPLPEVIEPPAAIAPEQLVADETLVEEVSIDGMCGVY